MQIDPASLPEDPIALREIAVNVVTENAGLRAEIDKLHLIIKAFQRHRFGQRSEQFNAEQKQLVLEDLEQATVLQPAKRLAMFYRLIRSSPMRSGRASCGSAISASFRHRCQGLRSPSTWKTRPARAARANCTGLARRQPRCWTSYRRRSG
jgi:Transposase C of IS166 homeodomain